MTGHPAILAEAITMRYPGQAKPVLTITTFTGE